MDAYSFYGKEVVANHIVNKIKRQLKKELGEDSKKPIEIVDKCLDRYLKNIKRTQERNLKKYMDALTSDRYPK